MPKNVFLYHCYLASRSKVGVKIMGRGQGQFSDVQQVMLSAVVPDSHVRSCCLTRRSLKILALCMLWADHSFKLACQA